MQKYEWLQMLAALLLLASGAWVAWAPGMAGDAQAAPSAAAPEVTARWRYTQVPPTDLAAVQQDETQLELRYQGYQRAWQAYVEQLHHCRARLPRTCIASPLQATCNDQALMQCLGAVVPRLDGTRGALHDQAIVLEQAAQRIAGEIQ